MTTEVDHTKDLCDGCGAILTMPADPTQKPTHACSDTVTVFHSMVGVTMSSVLGAVGEGEMLFRAEDGREWRFYHEQDCCENVSIEDVAGDLADLVGAPLLVAEEVTNDEPTPSEADQARDDSWTWTFYTRDDSWTWTFYKFATNKGAVTVRWYGSSNGYYSESVSFSEPAATVLPTDERDGSSYVLRDYEHGYFRGTLDGEDVVWTQEQRRALRFRDRDMAELAQVGHCPNAEVIKLVPKKRTTVRAAQR